MPTKGPELRDIHVPHVSMWWPLAPGWWVLFVLLLVAVAASVIYWRRRAAWRHYVNASLADLRDALAKHAVDADASAFAASASQLIRRVARTRDARSVSLSGQAWHDALLAMAPKLDITRLAALDAAKYQRHATIDVATVGRDVEAWVRAALRRPTAARAKREGGSHVPA